MAPTTNEDQIKFLITCIHYSNNGKPDFAQVAKECSIVTKGAAAKRYERLMKAHGFSTSASSSSTGTSTTTRTPPKTPRRTAQPSSKKRKLAAEEMENDTGDDDEFDGNFNVKAEFGGNGKERFKVEEDTMSQTPYFDAEERYEDEHVGGMKGIGAGDFYGLEGGVFNGQGQGQGFGMMSGYEVPVQMAHGEGGLNPYSFEYQGLVGGAEEGPILVE